MFRGEECRRHSGKREERYRMLEVDIRKKVKGFSLEIQITSDSRRIGILGASGCGKSMTLKSIAGIETPDEGRILVDGRCLFDRKAKINQTPQQRHLGYLFQNYALFPTMTVADNVEAGLRGYREEKSKKADEMLERFQLKGLAERLPGELSGGQQQRVALARIMAYEPELIMLDEPFSALDVYLKEQMQQEMSQMLKSYPGTVILVSHSRDEIYQFSDYLLVMDQGKIVRGGETREVFSHPGNRAAARLTGCKNISAAKKTGTYSLYASDWNLTLRTAEKVSDQVKFVGIRAHDLEPVKESGINCLACRINSVSEAPFETVYMIECPQRQQVIWWKTAKNRMDEEDRRNCRQALVQGTAGMTPYLQLPPERLMLLEG